ncbi:hypothetical protein ISS30_02440 [bacterium]|nr:hypothetical protein [bacterium]
MNNKTLIFIIFIISLALIPGAVNAAESPIHPDSKLLMGQIGYASYSGKYFEKAGSPLTQLWASPTYMQFMKPQFAFGLSVFYQGEWQGTLLNHYSFGIGPIAAYFWEMKGRDIYPYGTIYFRIFNQSSIPADPPRWRVSYLGPQIGFSFGIASMLSDTIALMTALDISYLNMSYIKDDAESVDPAMTSAVGYIVQLSVGIGGFIY